VIVDAGTGIFPLGRRLAPNPAHYDLLLSHLHWDHIQGLPFFAPLRHAGVSLTIHVPVGCLSLLRELVFNANCHRYLAAPFGRPAADIQFETFACPAPENRVPGARWSIGEIEIGTVNLNHPGHSVGFRLSTAGRSVVYYSDTAPFDEILFGSEYLGQAPHKDTKLAGAERERLAAMRQAAIDLAAGADLLIFDSHLTRQEYPQFPHYGHSTPDHALEMAIAAQVRELVLFHHAPARSDTELAKLEEQYRSMAGAHGVALRAAREGERINL
jgi:phosphoribosyl 1,2-cyclic phosphodiesterase